jgi:hypothetical protein
VKNNGTSILAFTEGKVKREKRRKTEK